MRMFLIGMTDIFLILYLTMITQTPSTSVLTVEDFFQLKATHETLQEERDALFARLAVEQERAEEMEESLIISDAELAQISKDLQMKEEMLKEREQLLAGLNQKIEDKEVTWKKMETYYKEELDSQKESLQASRMAAEKLQLEAQKAQHLANQMQVEVEQAYEIVEQAKAVQQNAILLKDEALKEKEEAEQKAREALQARKKAEEEKEQVEKKAEKLVTAIKDITQDGDTAYQSNVSPQIQQVSVTFERKIHDDIVVYERELTLMPVQINGQVFAIFPSQHVGFRRSSDKAPQELVIMYKGQKLGRYWINKEDDLIAVELPGYVGKASAPYPADTEIAQFMPVLLALRNSGSKTLGDLIRGLSDEYFIVNRDHIQPDERGGLAYGVEGFRGTGMRGERIIRGDQLVDLNGRLIGVAKDANRIIRIDTLNGWEERVF